MQFEHKRYIVIGTSDDSAEAIKTLINPKQRFAAEIELDELTLDDIQILEEHAKENLLDRLCELY